MKEHAIPKINLCFRILVFYTWLFFQNSGLTIAQTVHLQPTSNQNLQLNFFTFTKNDGLPSDNVYGLFQDSRHFIWIRTGNGLSRYDGIEFQNFFYTSKDTNSLAGNDVRSICEMPGDLIFLGTTNGLSIYNNRLNRFENWRVKDKAIKPGSNSIISSLLTDTSKNLWVNFNGDLDVYDSLFRFKFRYTDTEQGKILKGILTGETSFSFDEEGNLWFTHDNFGVVHIQSRTLQPTCFKNNNDPVYTHEIISGHYLDSHKSLLWYSPWGMGLYRYDLKSKVLKRYTFKSSTDFFINLRNIIYCILPFQHYLLCASNDGVIVFDTLTESYFVLTHNKSNPFSIPDNGITSIIIDKDNLLWLATDNGICKSNLNKSPFGFLSEELKGSNTGSPVEINHFTVYQSSWLIIGTETDGLYAYNLKTHERKHYLIKNAKNNAENFFGKVFIDRTNKIWVSSYYGLRIYNLEKNKIEKPSLDFAGLHPGICIAFFQDSHLDYWMSYEGDPKLIHCVNEGNFRYRLEKYYHDPGKFPLQKINRIQEDFQGNIWISTNWALGFLKWSRSENRFKRFPKVKSTEDYLSESVNDLLPDHGNSIWLASGAGHGLISYNYVTNQQQGYTTDNGLISNNLISLFKHNNKIWISTDNGISQFDPQTKKFINFTQEDGLPETDFTRKFVYDSASNLLFASTPHYIVYFNPDSISHNKRKDETSGIYLKKFQANGNTIYHDFSTVLNLSPSDNSINLEFSCINFNEGDKTNFEYQLEGLEHKWNQGGKRRFVTYANLDPGTYRFKVRTTFDAVNYSVPVAIASFIIETPFYLTWWFILIVIVIVLSVVYIIHVNRQKNQKALVAMRERISRDLHDDIGSTLNSISIYSEIAKLKNTEEAQREKFLETIGSSSRNMIEQMNDIVWTVNPMNDKFENILLRMRSFASELSEGTNMQFHIEVDENCKSISVGMNERKNLYLIFKEAVNNAVKYSGGTVVNVKVNMKETSLVLAIADNGKGFDTSNEDVAKRGGNGLRNMKIRADEIKAELIVHSAIDKGTTVELKMRV